MKRLRFHALVIALAISMAVTEAQAQRQSLSWAPGGDGQSSVGSGLDDWVGSRIVLPLALLIQAGIYGGNIYGIATRRGGGFRATMVLLSYALGGLQGLVGTVVLARKGDDLAQEREDRIVGYTALGLAALNIGLALWNHLGGPGLWDYGASRKRSPGMRVIPAPVAPGRGAQGVSRRKAPPRTWIKQVTRIKQVKLAPALLGSKRGGMGPGLVLSGRF